LSHETSKPAGYCHGANRNLSWSWGGIRGLSDDWIKVTKEGGPNGFLIRRPEKKPKNGQSKREVSGPIIYSHTQRRKLGGWGGGGGGGGGSGRARPKHNKGTFLFAWDLLFRNKGVRHKDV